MSDRCYLCPRDGHPVYGDGPKSCRLFFCGETPGSKDQGRPYVGWAGREFNFSCLPKILGLNRDEVYLTNVAKCFAARGPDGNLLPKIAESCSDYFIRSEIRRVHPEIVVLMGAKACKLSSVPIDLELHHGQPVVTTIQGLEVLAVPIFHPSESSHDSGMLRFIHQDFRDLKRILESEDGEDGESTIPEDEYPDPDYRLLTEPDELADYLRGADEGAIDTENTPDDRIWCSTITTRPGTGRLLRTDGSPLADTLLRILRGWMMGGTGGTAPVGGHGYGARVPGVQRSASGVGGRGIRTVSRTPSPSSWPSIRRPIRLVRPFIYLHHALHDLEILHQVGCEPPPSRYADTMQYAYHQAVYGQGLKTLAYRLCGMRMRSFEDTVLPYSEDVEVDWLMEADTVNWGKSTPVWDEKKGKMRKPQPLNTKLRTILRKVGKEDSKGLVKSIFSRWKDIDPVERAVIERELGAFPEPSIEHVPLKVAIQYACRDSDATLRIAHVLKRNGREIARRIHAESREKIYVPAEYAS